MDLTMLQSHLDVWMNWYGFIIATETETQQYSKDAGDKIY